MVDIPDWNGVTGRRLLVDIVPMRCWMGDILDITLLVIIQVEEDAFASTSVQSSDTGELYPPWQVPCTVLNIALVRTLAYRILSSVVSIWAELMAYWESPDGGTGTPGTFRLRTSPSEYTFCVSNMWLYGAPEHVSWTV